MKCAICGRPLIGYTIGSIRDPKHHAPTCPIFVGDKSLVEIIDNITGNMDKNVTDNEKPMSGTKRVWDY